MTGLSQYEAIGRRALVWHPLHKHYVWVTWKLHKVRLKPIQPLTRT